MKIYGIDLGTTNSLIYYGEKQYGDLVPSVVNFDKHRAGKEFYEEFDDSVERSFKKNMSLGVEGRKAVDASAEVLKELCRRVTDDKVSDVVITVPAYFTDNNRQATRESAEKAGLTVRRIINEPTAAALYYNRNRKSVTLVYDLGGGTFDISLIDNRLGSYSTITTDGEKTGGDDLDMEIRRAVINGSKMSSHRLHDNDIDRLKIACCKLKLEVQHTGKDSTIDLSDYLYTGCSKSYTLKVNDYKEIMKIVFKTTLRKTKCIIADYIPKDQSYNLLLVGGSTRDPFLRMWLEDELGKQPVDMTYNPDKIVAQGVAYYAKLMEDGTADDIVSDIVSSPIGMGMFNGTVNQLIPKDARLPYSVSKPFTNSADTDKLVLDIYQGNSVLIANSELIGEMLYEYGKEIKAGKGIVTITLSVNRDGIISIKAKYGIRKAQTMTLDRKVFTRHIND